METRDVSILYGIAQAAMEGCNWPSLRERLLEVAEESALDLAWMNAQREIGRTQERLMEPAD